MEYKITGLISTETAAKILNISRSKLENLRYAGKGPAYFCEGRSIKYRPEDIDKYINSMTITPPDNTIH